MPANSTFRPWRERQGRTLDRSASAPRGAGRRTCPVARRTSTSAVNPRPLPGRVWDDGYEGVALGLLADLPDLRSEEAFWSGVRIMFHGHHHVPDSCLPRTRA